MSAYNCLNITISSGCPRIIVLIKRIIYIIFCSTGSTNLSLLVLILHVRYTPVSQAPPEHSSTSQVTQFQSLVLGSLLESIKAGVAAGTGVLEGAWVRDQGHIPAGGASQHVPPNLFYLVARMVDKLWAGKES